MSWKSCCKNRASKERRIILTKIKSKGDEFFSIRSSRPVFRTCPVCFESRPIVEFMGSRFCRDCKIKYEGQKLDTPWYTIIVRDGLIIDVWLNYGVWLSLRSEWENGCARCGNRFLVDDHVALATTKGNKQFVICHACGLEVLETLVRKDM